MTEADPNTSVQSASEQRMRNLALGVGAGAICGLIASYLYSRAAEEQPEGDAGTPRSISTGQLLAVLLAILGVIRQVAELGKPKKPGKK